MTIQRVNVLGVGISAINMKVALAAMAEAVAQRRKGYVCVTGVHGVMEAHDDPAFRQILNGAFLCTPDGMPMVWVGRLCSHSQMSRVYGPDLMLEVCAWSQTHACRHFFLGGAPRVAEELRDRLKKRYPSLLVVGCYAPPFRPLNEAEESDLTRLVKEAKPDIMWVGLSTPKQEKFMAEYLAKLDVTLMVGVGAAFDFHAGRVRQSPPWLRRCGLEWFYRLCQEPRRLWRRYFRNNPLFVARILCQLTGLKKYVIE